MTDEIVSRPTIAIAILFYEKVEQTIECVLSVVSSELDIYILNNGSSNAARDQLDRLSDAYPNITIVDSKVNLGIATGRNRLIRSTSTEWLFFLDSDIIVSTSDWYTRFLQHISAYPSADVIVPRLFESHRGCYLDRTNFEISGETLKIQPTSNNLTNKFPGGASLISRKLFDRVGLYEEQMFIGFEDFELSLRAMRSGSSVASLHVADVELIHEHRPVLAAGDRRAVLVRYDKAKLRQSYDFLVSRHGVELELDYEVWADSQLSQLVPGL
jgi:GT2 family glycosyltransferase